MPKSPETNQPNPDFLPPIPDDETFEGGLPREGTQYFDDLLIDGSEEKTSGKIFIKMENLPVLYALYDDGGKYQGITFSHFVSLKLNVDTNLNFYVTVYPVTVRDRKPYLAVSEIQATALGELYNHEFFDHKLREIPTVVTITVFDEEENPTNLMVPLVVLPNDLENPNFVLASKGLMRQLEKAGGPFRFEITGLKTDLENLSLENYATTQNDDEDDDDDDSALPA